jgi:hypothetical protein
MKKLIYSLVLAVVLCSTVFAGHAYAKSNVSFSISFSQPAYVPVCAAPQPVYVYPAPAYVPVQPGCTFGFSAFWSNRNRSIHHDGHGYYDGHRNNFNAWRGHR